MSVALVELLPTQQDAHDVLGPTWSLNKAQQVTVPSPYPTPSIDPDQLRQAILADGKQCVDAQIQFAPNRPAAGAQYAGIGGYDNAGGTLVAWTAERYGTAAMATQRMEAGEAFVAACAGKRSPGSAATGENMVVVQKDHTTISDAIAFENPNDLGDGDRWIMARRGNLVLVTQSRKSTTEAESMMNLQLNKLDTLSKKKAG